MQRRICPGRHFAEAMLWFAIATILATTRLSKAKDEFGNEILPSAAFTGDTVRYVRDERNVSANFTIDVLAIAAHSRSLIGLNRDLHPLHYSFTTASRTQPSIAH